MKTQASTERAIIDAVELTFQGPFLIHSTLALELPLMVRFNRHVVRHDGWNLSSNLKNC